MEKWNTNKTAANNKDIVNDDIREIKILDGWDFLKGSLGESRISKTNWSFIDEIISRLVWFFIKSAIADFTSGTFVRTNFSWRKSIELE